MILTITRIELNSYSTLRSFFKLNAQIIRELKLSPCIKYQMTGKWNLKVWYTMTLWENEKDLQHFYRSGTHLEAMKRSATFSSKIQSVRKNSNTLLPWKEAKKLFAQNIASD